MKSGDVYKNRNSPNRFIRIVSINGPDALYQIQNTGELIHFWNKKEIEKLFIFDQKLTDEYTIKDIIE